MAACFLAAVLAILSSCGPSESTQQVGDEKSKDTALTAFAEPAHIHDTIYAWAVPISFAPFFDHTWVTSTKSVNACPPNAKNYWYCWGVCHTTGVGTKSRLLSKQIADVTFAECITTPNSDAINADTHGGITGFYGYRGVCHQVANRTLYATAAPGTKPLTVEGVNGYKISHFLYGTYGRGLSKSFAERIAKCNLDTLNIKNDVKEVEFALQKVVSDKSYNMASKTYFSAQSEVYAFMDSLGVQVEERKMTIVQYGNALHKKVTTVYQKKLLPAMGEKAYTAMFDIAPKDLITIMDMEVAAKEDEMRK